MRIYRPSAEHPELRDDRGVPRAQPPRGYIHIEAVAAEAEQVFSANLYLAVPSAGGEFLLWNVRMPFLRPALHGDFAWDVLRNLAMMETLVGSLEGMNTLRPEVQEALVAALPAPLVVRPEPGDLVTINPCAPHSVCEGRRVSVQSFLNRRPGRPTRMLA